MDTIYEYKDEFNADTVINDINVIASELKKESEKPEEERNKDREMELIYAQFIRGLRLSTGQVF